ncbi:MAG: hypothetical protein ACJ751_26175, partial [Niastella sp.]|uniref:hypothetical protein n=1 Tax=Niastella sp. TaxID=1869183 RepID=UPI00389A2FA6
GYVQSNPTLNKYTLNVASGDVRFKSFSGNGDVLAGSDNNGVLNKITPGNGLYIEDSTLFLIQPEPADQGGNYQTYSAVLDEYQQGNPQEYVSESSISANIVWTRDSVGHYTATASYPIFYAPFTWLHSHPADPSGNVGATRLYRTSPTTLKLVVKDNNLNDTDVWRRITIEMRVFISG